MIDNGFPLEPIHGQEYIDIYNVKWIFSIDCGWVKIGPIITVQVAKSGQECQEETE